ncbi:MAG: hypothetical protein K2G63_06755 [Oscillospiraceae bacterium]|nr:hypothetical protein [Oscillospiraceae bacterium]
MNINKKKLFILPVIFSAFLMLCGCTYQEVHQKAYLRNISVSGDDIKTVFMNFYNEDLSPAKTENCDFESILKNSEILSGKSIFTGHTEVIILGDCNYTETLKYILEEWKVSPSCLIVYGGENSGNIIENSDSDTLADILRTAVKQKRIPENDIITVLSSLLKNNQAEIPVITSDGNLDKTIIS